MMKSNKLNNFLIGYHKFSMVSFDKKRILCEVNNSFSPHDLRELERKTGHTPVLATQDGSSYVIFNR